VYKRLVKPGQKPGAAQSMATFVTSAFWHGIAPGYYLAFVTAGMVQYIGKQFRHLFRPYFLPADDPAAALKLPKWHSQPLAKRAYDIVGWFLVQVNLNYLVAPFLLLELKPSIMAWHRMYWYTHVQIAFFLIVMRLGLRRWLRKGLKPRGKKEAEKTIPELKLSPPTPTEYNRRPEGDEDGPDNDVEWVKYDLNTHALENEGVDMDGGLMDQVLTEMETRPGTPHLHHHNHKDE
jgi:lysophospholipid acyltransferase